MVATISTRNAMAPEATVPHVHSLTQPVDSLRPLDVFRLGNPAGRFWWSDPVRQVSFAGLGAAWRGQVETIEESAQNLASTFTSLRDYSESLPEYFPRLAGGLAFFSGEARLDGWASFGNGSFVLPEIMCVRIGSEIWLTANQVQKAGTPPAGFPEILKKQIQLITAAATSASAYTTGQISKPIVAVDIESKTEWFERINIVLAAIRKDELEKVVLVRRRRIGIDKSPDLAGLVSELSVAQPESYQFVVEAADGSAFVGASPELLASVRGPNLETVALAGTAPRGLSEERDMAHALRLLEDPKERREHQHVVDGIQAALSSLAKTVEVDPQPGIRQLPGLQHLETRISAMLLRDYHVLDAVAALHPTPALCGTPRQKAADLIRDLEPQGRGWFGGPVGWLDAQGNGDFAVGIRSALIESNGITVFGGAGIVEGSVPEMEWNETALKMDAMSAVLFGEGYEAC